MHSSFYRKINLHFVTGESAVVMSCVYVLIVCRISYIALIHISERCETHS